MDKTTLLVVVALLGLGGCINTHSPAFLVEPVEIDSSELNNYWERETSKVIRLSGRPDWIPKGAGKASYFIIIDSDGTEIGKELINSVPEGWMTQRLLNKMPKQQYKASINNPNKTPVKVKVLSEVKRMSKANLGKR